MKLFSKKVTQNHAVTKAFSYEKDGITLSFSLRIDEKKGLKAFEELLVEALDEVRSELIKQDPDWRTKIVTGGGAQ